MGIYKIINKNTPATNTSSPRFRTPQAKPNRHQTCCLAGWLAGRPKQPKKKTILTFSHGGRCRTHPATPPPPAPPQATPQTSRHYYCRYAPPSRAYPTQANPHPASHPTSQRPAPQNWSRFASSAPQQMTLHPTPHDTSHRAPSPSHLSPNPTPGDSGSQATCAFPSSCGHPASSAAATRSARSISR